MSEHCISPVRTQRVRRVGFAIDFLRFEMEGEHCVNFQPRNRAWLKELLRPALREVDPELILSDVCAPTLAVDMERSIANPELFAAYRRDAAGAWASQYDLDSPQILLQVFEQLLEHDLVVGFELPPVVKRFLHRRGRPYLNLSIHPLRFLRDLCFGASTNAPWIAAALRDCAVPAIEMDRQCQRFRALFLRRELEAYAIPAGLPVLIGQTARDSILIRNGTFDDWRDHSAELTELVKDHDALVLLEHPQRSNSSSIVEFLRSELGKTVIATNANGYGLLLSNSQIPAVITLASSLGAEAQTFGLPTHFLLADPRDKFAVRDVESQDHSAYGHRLLHPSFWEAVCEAPTRKSRRSPARADAFDLGEHYVRNSLDGWSYRALQYGLEVGPTRKTLVPGGDLDDSRRNMLLGGLLSYRSDSTATPAQAIHRARALGLHVELMDPPLALGESRSIATGGHAASTYLAEGFHALEAWGGWSKSLEATIAFPLEQAAVERGSLLRVRLQIRVYDGLIHSHPVLKIAHDDKVIGFAFFRPGVSSAQNLELTVQVTSSIVRLNLELTGLESPAARGDSLDARWLGFGVYGLDVLCVPNEEERLSGEHRSVTAWGIDRTPVDCSPESCEG